MGDCPHCHLFSGVPTCPSCKTYFRLGHLLQGGKLSVYQESAVLGALRNCAGALSYLVEVGGGGPFGAGGPGAVAAPAEEIGRSPVVEEPNKVEEPEKKEKKEEASKKDKSKEAKKAKAAKKEKRRSSKKARIEKERSRSKSKGKRSPESGERKRTNRGTALESISSRIGHRKDRDDEPLRRESSRRREDRREEQEDKDKEVRRHPERFGLEHLPIRGSAGRHLSGPPIPAGHRRPPEPAGSPPSRGGATEERQNSDQRGRDYGEHSPEQRKPPRWKGYAHVERGRQYWQNQKRRRHK